MAELHIVGTLQGASQFPHPELTCKWAIIAGEDWKLLEGEDSGQTQVDIPAEDSEYTVWSHPIDIHYATKSIEGWPKLQLQGLRTVFNRQLVYHQDSYGRNELYGYGFIHIPTIPGSHELECVTWRPVGKPIDRLYSFFLNATPQLRNFDLIHTPSDRYQLTTESMGKVHIEIMVVTRNFLKQGVKQGMADY
jgi:B9 domain-containing protein 2